MGAGVGVGDKPQQQQMNSVNDNQAGGPGGANDAPGAAGLNNDEPDRQDKNTDGGNAIKNEGGVGNGMDKNEDGDKTKENAGDKNDSVPDDMTVEIAVDGSMSMTVEVDGSMSMSMGY